MAFWVASPSMDPEIYALSAAALGLPIATARLLGALGLSLAAGFIVYALERRGHLMHTLRDEAPEQEATPSCKSANVSSASCQEPAVAGTVTVPSAIAVMSPAGLTTPPAIQPASFCASAAVATDGSACSREILDDHRPWREFIRDNLPLQSREIARNVWEDSMGLGKWLLLAIVLEALLVRYVPQNVVATTLGSQGVFAIPLASLISVPLYLNGVGAIPIAAGLLRQGMESAASVTFLLGG
jgi:uncharacterized protein